MKVRAEFIGGWTVKVRADFEKESWQGMCDRAVNLSGPLPGIMSLNCELMFEWENMV